MEFVIARNPDGTRPVGEPAASDVRARFAAAGFDVAERGRLRAEIWAADHTADAPEPGGVSRW
ncbi:hypothetical protein BH24ACT5_BH24ACT5_01480 [soil metagenome]